VLTVVFWVALPCDLIVITTFWKNRVACIFRLLHTEDTDDNVPLNASKVKLSHYRHAGTKWER